MALSDKLRPKVASKSESQNIKKKAINREISGAADETSPKPVKAQMLNGY
jgi:hypothetical protein